MSVSPLGGGEKSVSPLGLCIAHMSRCVRSGCKRSLWRHPLHRRQMLAVAAGAQAGRLPHGLIQRLPPLLSSAFRS